MESYQHTMTDKIKLIYHVPLFHNYFSWEKELLVKPNDLQEQKKRKDENSRAEAPTMCE
jgi:hypothetical protein